jgi:hypothetical protein
MKIWISFDGCDYVIHADEPKWSSRYGVWVSQVEMGNVCVAGLKKIGFSPLPCFIEMPEDESDCWSWNYGSECIEYSLAGKKPRYICTWLPPEE